MELLNSKQIKKLTALDGVRMYGSAFGFEGVRHQGIAFNLYRFIGSPKYDNEYKMIKINHTFYNVSPTRFRRIEEGRFHLDITQPLTLEIVDEAMAKLFIPREIKVYCLRRIYRTCGISLSGDSIKDWATTYTEYPNSKRSRMRADLNEECRIFHKTKKYNPRPRITPVR